MRCTEPHYQGNKFIPRGTILPDGHPEIIPLFFEPFNVDFEDDSPPPKKASKR